MNLKKQTELLQNLAWLNEKIGNPTPELPANLSSEILLSKVNFEKNNRAKIPYFSNFSKLIPMTCAVIFAVIFIFSSQLDRNYTKQNLQFSTIPAVQTLRLTSEEMAETNKLAQISAENLFILSEFGDVYLIIENEYKFIAVLCGEFEITEDKTLKITDLASGKFLEFDSKTLEIIE